MGDPELSATVVLQVATRSNDYFVEIDRKKLHSLFEVEDLKERARQFWEATKPFAVTSTGMCDYELVLDGKEDEESWEDLKGSLED